jgi:hypothetical protein
LYVVVVVVVVAASAATVAFAVPVTFAVAIAVDASHYNFLHTLFAMSFVENYTTSIASGTLRLRAFRRVFTAISNLASTAALFFDMLGNSVY